MDIAREREKNIVLIFNPFKIRVGSVNVHIISDLSAAARVCVCQRDPNDYYTAVNL